LGKWYVTNVYFKFLASGSEFKNICELIHLYQQSKTYVDIIYFLQNFVDNGMKAHGLGIPFKIHFMEIGI